MFAIVRFTSSQRERWIVLASEIKHFHPVTDRDFSSEKKYRVKWQKSDLDGGEDGCYECHIICLGGSLQDLKSNAAKMNCTLPRRKSILAAPALGSANGKQVQEKTSLKPSDSKRERKLSGKAMLSARRRTANQILKAVKDKPILAESSAGEKLESSAKGLHWGNEDMKKSSPEEKIIKSLNVHEVVNRKSPKKNIKTPEKKRKKSPEKKAVSPLKPLQKSKNEENKDVSSTRAQGKQLQYDAKSSSPLEENRRQQSYDLNIQHECASLTLEGQKSTPMDKGVETYETPTKKIRMNKSANDTLPLEEEEKESEKSYEIDSDFAPKRTSSFVYDSEDNDSDLQSNTSEDSTSDAIQKLEENYKKKIQDLRDKLEYSTKEVSTLRAAVKISDNVIRDLKTQLGDLQKNSVQNKDVMQLVASVNKMVNVFKNSSFSSQPVERSYKPPEAAARRISFDDSVSHFDTASYDVLAPSPNRAASPYASPSTGGDVEDKSDDTNSYIMKVSNAVLQDMQGVKPLPLDSKGTNVVFPGGLKINSQVWRANIKPAKRESLLVRKMSTQLWGYDGLKNRSLKGGKNSRSGIKKPQATPSKIHLIAGCVRAFTTNKQSGRNPPAPVLSPEAALSLAEIHVGRAMVDEISKAKKDHKDHSHCKAEQSSSSSRKPSTEDTATSD